MTHCTEGLTVMARGGAVSWHTALRALHVVARGGAALH